MMNHVNLKAGEGLYLPAGNIHAYLCGLGVEIMAASDNVLRGGLTPKYVDVGELQSVVQFVSQPVEVLEPKPILTGLARYEADCPDFALYRVDVTGATVLADLKISHHSILLCTGGEISISDSLGEHVVVRRGEAALITADARFVTLAGNGDAFLAC
jgi:mannose-6-phosphate isomerase